MEKYKLINEITSLSYNKESWELAKKEWDIESIYNTSNEKETCLCGHYPINEVCVLKNNKNNNRAIVGNCCVKKFIKGSGKIIDSVKRVQKDKSKSFNLETIGLAYDNKWIDTWEHNFYKNIQRKRNLSSLQTEKKNKINEKILLEIMK